MPSTKTIITSNGPGYVLPIDALFARLASDVLDPTFEEYGDFVEAEGAKWSFFGNFQTYSHVFNIVTSDAKLAKRLIAAIKANKATPAYATAKIEHIEGERAHKEALRLADEKLRAEKRARALRELEVGAA